MGSCREGLATGTASALHHPPGQVFWLDPDDEMHKTLISSGNEMRSRKKALGFLLAKRPWD